MASAEVSEQRVVKIALELSEEEAQFLHFILGHVGGDPVLSVRRHARAVMVALDPLVPAPTAKIGWRDRLRAARNYDASITFKDDSDVGLFVGDRSA